MPRFHALSCVLVLVGVSGCASTANELRGAWVTAWSDGFFTPEEVESTVAVAEKAGLNALFIQVRREADAYYVSATEPRPTTIAADFDPLRCVIEKAHARKIEVHAWINCCRVWAPKDAPTDPKHVANRHPDWLSVDFDGKQRASEGLYLDPGVPEAREYLASVAQEIARSYDVDGIHLDYIRYPGAKWGYSELALKRYRAATTTSGRPAPDDPKWMQWRRDQVTALVKLVRQKIRAVKRGVKLTASTIVWGDCPASFSSSAPYAQCLQDWRRWMLDGLLDANVPMNYKTESSARSAQQFRNWLAGFKKWSGGRPVYVGIGAHINPVADVLQQIEAVKKARLGGFVLFAFNQSAKREALVENLGGKQGR